MHEQLHEYVGVIHIHSTYSDGSRPIPEIAAIASEVELDFLMFTDHNTLQPKRDGLEGWYGNVLVAVGYEINDKDDLNHYLAFNVSEEVSPSDKPEIYVRKVEEQGGFGIIAHPDEKRKAMEQYPAYPWTLWESGYFHGIEIWNQMSEWLEGLTHTNKYWRVFNPRRAIINPMPETLKRWDEVNRERPVVGIGGVDAHGHIYKLWGLFRITIFRYKVLFKTIRTHILTESALSGETDPQGDIKSLYDSLLDCRCFISNFYCGDARGFRFWAENNTDKVQLGGKLKFEPNTHFHVNLPHTAKAVLICNGDRIDTRLGTELIFEARRPGLYRIEVYVSDRPWIFSNHIRLS